MSWLERRSSGQYHIVFRLGNQRFKRSLKTANEGTAEAQRVRLDENIRLVESGRLIVPTGTDVPTFLLSDGKLNGKLDAPKRLTLAALFREYLDNLPEGAMESNSLYTAKIHMDHFERILGKRFSARELKLTDLQGYVRERSKAKGRRKRPLSPSTIRKEMATFSAVWNWAIVAGRVEGPFPNRSLKYPKASEKPPFQTREEIKRQLARGGLSRVEEEELWDCLYLTLSDIEKVLAFVKKSARVSFIYPMCVMAAHTGARRSELLRAEINDFDMENNTVRLREKKRVKGKRSTRLVPISPPLHQVMQEWLAEHPEGRYVFCHELTAEQSNGNGAVPRPITVDESTDHFRRTLNGSKWRTIRGWHVFRHSFISNCAAKGIDQRMIDTWSGHQTEEMRKRYTHLFPDSQQDAIRSVFGKTFDR